MLFTAQKVGQTRLKALQAKVIHVINGLSIAKPLAGDPPGRVRRLTIFPRVRGIVSAATTIRESFNG
jgi:hypothetical protein